jgi:crotonobetainyl-CoA:carnitine CoA-transferase CaiB-like acyl-CoA transferase
LREGPAFISPLTGMRVVDLSQQLPGPSATLLLAGLGARVSKGRAAGR